MNLLSHPPSAGTLPAAAVALSLVLLGAVPAHAQQTEESLPCLVDEELSLWLALESVDRTIAALERERRELAQELGATLEAFDVLTRAEDPDEVGLAELSALVEARSVGLDAIRDAYADIENRLVDIDQTLKRRRAQQAALEARLEALDQAPAEE